MYDLLRPPSLPLLPSALVEDDVLEACEEDPVAVAVASSCEVLAPLSGFALEVSVGEHSAWHP